MNLTQNDKIEQIKNETLVVRVDIDKENHYTRAFDNRDRELKKYIRFANTREGFIAFDKWASEVSLTNEKTDVKVGFEPTGRNSLKILKLEEVYAWHPNTHKDVIN